MIVRLLSNLIHAALDWRFVSKHPIIYTCQEEAMKEWEKHEKHDQDVRGLFSELGFSDSKGQVRQFNGKVFWPRLRKLGHTSVGFDTCGCSVRGHLRIAK